MQSELISGLDQNAGAETLSISPKLNRNPRTPGLCQPSLNHEQKQVWVEMMPWKLKQGDGKKLQPSGSANHGDCIGSESSGM